MSIVYYHRTLFLLYCFRPLRCFLLVSSLLVPFYQLHGLSFKEIFFLESVWATTIILLELPGGLLSDAYGRSFSLQGGALFNAAGYILFCFADSYISFLCVQIMFGIAYSLISGSDSALAYEWMKCYQDTGSYQVFERRSHAYSGFSEGLAGVLACYLVREHLELPFLVQAAVACILFLITLFLKDPDGGVIEVLEQQVKDRFWVMNDSRKKKYIFLTAYVSVLGTLTHTMVILTAPYYQAIGIPLPWYGLLWTLQLLFMGVCSLYQKKLEDTLGRTAMYYCLPLIGILSYFFLALGMSLSMYPCILGFYCVRGMLYPFINHELHACLPNHRRASMMSCMNLIQKICYACLGLCVASVMDSQGLKVTLYFSAGLYGFLSLIVLSSLVREGDESRVDTAGLPS